MNRRVWLALSALLGMGLVAIRAAEKEKPRPGPPPLVISKDAPRLADAPEGPPKPSGKAVADNEACYCCHTNYQEESFAGCHAASNVGCMKCHGESVAHRNDEDNITPPDTMFAADTIEKNCKTCHETHDAPAAKVLSLWQEKCPAKTNPKDLVCTDCHGEHRLRFRTIWWDKKTGKLATRAKGERIKMAPDLTKVPADKKAPAQKKPGDSLDLDAEMR